MMRSFALPLFLLAASVAADFDIKLEYSFDDWASAKQLGGIKLSSYDGANYTGSFVLADTAKGLGRELSNYKDAVYSVRASSSAHPGKVVMSSTQPCLILRASLMHEFYVTVVPRTRSLLALTVFPDPLFLDDNECPETVPAASPGGVVVVASEGVLPAPDTAAYLEKIENERRARQHGAESDNRSFLAKYWMYILPVVVVMLLSNAAAPQEGGE